MCKGGTPISVFLDPMKEKTKELEERVTKLEVNYQVLLSSVNMLKGITFKRAKK